MKHRIRRGVVLVACAIAAWAIPGCGEDPEPTGDDYTQDVMREIFDGIRVTLPASIDPDVFSAPENQGEIFAALDSLARNAALLEAHAQGCNAEMGFLARSAERDAIEAKTSYRHGHYKRAAFVLRQIVESCVICHTRLPDDCGSRIAEEFVDEGVMASLPAHPRSALLIATRQFDRALEALEEVLTDPLTHPAIMLGPLTDYMVVAVRVLGDYERPIPVFRTFARRKDLWPSLREDVNEWIAALPSLQERTARASTVTSARAIIEEGEALDEYGDGQGSLLHFIAASSILERYIEAHPTRNAELGEAYYLRGILETRIGRNYWVTTAPFFLEESIRIAPKAPSAAEAIVVLEREMLAAYEGSDIEELPDAEEKHLAELRALIEGS
ncbi:MAG: hypothetical protein JRE43_03410 [Deltaproteobacteria bacterium]|jgi:hypothetical protein|nr:hypothetical protein [Deltaproteobacteria bacterium]MBW2542471.1 hypothetical protein [Deltaproteobacteria bacterium]